MYYRTLGKTGLRVSYLSFGASSLGSMFRRVEESDGIRAVRTALDLGINYIDVSPFYGLTTAEEVLGKALAGVSRDQYYLATKVGRYGDTFFDFTPERVTKSVDESLRRMHLDCLDVIQCHDIEYGDLDFVIQETIPALEKLKESGKVRFVGITGLPLFIFEYVLDRIDVDLILSYSHYSLNDTSLLYLLPYLKEKGVGIVSASLFSLGLLTQRGAPAWHPAPQIIRDTCRRAADYCKEAGKSLEKLALQYALDNPDIDTTLVGTADPENVRRNVTWLDEPLDTELLEAVQKIVHPILNCTWPLGQPENNRDIRNYRVRWSV